LEHLEVENKFLRERLSKYENPKNSSNSSIPPSMDINAPKKNQSLRNPSGRKPGGQRGHKGKTLEMSSTPDTIVELRPDYCRGCGASLKNTALVKERSRQVVDIRPIRAVCTEYRSYVGQCSCGCRTVADFPKGVDSPVSYGHNIEGLIGYFHARQYLPFKRMGEMINDVFNINISEGGIHCLLTRFANKTTPLYNIIKQRINLSKVIGTDETGVKVNANKHWFWTWQTTELTYIAHSPSRGKAAIDANFPNGFPKATLVHDGWRAQSGTTALHHQTCLPHLLRHLNYLNQKYRDNTWGHDFKKLLYHAMKLANKDTGQNTKTQRTKTVMLLQELLDRPPDKKDKELHTFYKRMRRERQQLFTFLFIENVPSDNNASERAIRNVKVKQKISGQFKTERTAKNFAKIRSVIDTSIKNGMNVVEALTLIAKLQPQITY
jgi:transposase